MTDKGTLLKDLIVKRSLLLMLKKDPRLKNSKDSLEQNNKSKSTNHIIKKDNNVKNFNFFIK
ncbi:hypothetical protein HNQ02_003087 [Flavobacterium sp. 7E]|nr:hypothetical protein [Flavobacterium sp. 7E]NRS90150.1 hypothetical protein [Flavobacterium sp. 7E]